MDTQDLLTSTPHSQIGTLPWVVSHRQFHMDILTWTFSRRHSHKTFTYTHQDPLEPQDTHSGPPDEHTHPLHRPPSYPTCNAIQQDIRRHKADKAANSSPTKIWDNETRSFQDKTWINIQVGDFILVGPRCPSPPLPFPLPCPSHPPLTTSSYPSPPPLPVIRSRITAWCLRTW
jgi:hypothetical protein